MRGRGAHAMGAKWAICLSLRDVRFAILGSASLDENDLRHPDSDRFQRPPR